MPQSPFVHLHCHSHYSLLDGASRVPELVAHVKKLGMNACAITDHGNLFGAIEFYLACREAGINPIVGCCLPGQLIHTQEGVKPIESIKPSEKVLTHRGVFRPVIRVMSRHYSGPIHGLRAANCNRVWLTSEHPVLIADRYYQNLHWLRADSLKAGRAAPGRLGVDNWCSHVVLPRLRTKENSPLAFLNLTDYLDPSLYEARDGRIYKKKVFNKFDRAIHFDIPASVPVTTDLAALLGLFIAEGSFQRDAQGRPAVVVWTFNNGKDAPLVEQVARTLREVFHLDCEKRERPDKHLLEVYCRNTVLARLLHSWCGAGAANKKIPSFVYQFASEHLQAFVQALASGDGKIDSETGHVTLKMASRQIIYAMRLLIARLGYAGKATECRQENGTYYLLTWTPEPSYRRHGVDENFLFLPLKDVQTKNYDGLVFNLEVAEDNSYVTDFVVHNCEVYVAPGPRTQREAKKRGEAGYHLTLLARNAIGFKNLIKMASVAYLEGYYYVPRIDKELLASHHEGIICLSGCANSEFSELILRDQMAEAEKLCAWFAQLFGKDFYIEVQNNSLDIQRLCAQGAIDIANKMGLPLVATSDAHYLTREDAPAHDVLLCINTGKTLNDPNRLRYGNGDGRMVDQFYVCGPDEMYHRFPELPDAVRRSQEIADGVDIRLPLNARHFPVFTPPAGKTPEDHLRELCEKGLRERYGDNPSQAVRDRLEHELDVICRMGFASYFLIVWDFVHFAVENGIPCSARGSGCGALVSYVLKLSHVDPLEYDLLFERFLDPNRSEAPDIDIDFCQERREEVIAYVKRKYGEESVAQIGTFGTLAARAAIKDVGRVLDVPLDRVTQLTNMVPKTLGITLDEALQQSAELRQAYQSDPQIHELIDIARKLECTNRNAGTHAAGVVIANGPLSDYVPLQRVVRKGGDAGSRGSEAVVTTQWVMGDLEKVGLLKMDFLGLRTLTLLDKAVRLIEKTRSEKIDVYKLPLDDPETYQLLQRGDAKGVFQLENEGIRELSKRMKPDSFRDIIAINALYRPGPLQGGMVDAYVNRKHGREKPVYPHPVMEEILGKTYGIMVYQEDVMRILNRLGGIELSSAYACIKAISKKKQDIIEQRRAEFLKGAVERGVNEATARDIFDLILYFGGYGFNASHSAAYALIAYQTAYLKTHYAPEFMAALLSSEIDDGNKRDVMVDHIADARKMGVAVLPPDVNVSDSEFTVHDGQIVFGLTAIKGVGRSSSEEIVRASKEGGRFKDIFDFCERVDLRILNRATIERLIKAGALDRLGGHRAQLMNVLPRAIQSATERQADQRLGQRNLFDAFAVEESAAAAVETKEALPDVPPWTETDKLKYEKEVLDFYLSSHPLAQNEKLLARYRSHSAEEMKQLAADQEATLAGMFTQIALKNTQKARNGNSRYFLARIEDMSGSAKCVMWPDDFARLKEEIRDDIPYIIKGTVDRRREEPTLVINRILTLKEAQGELARGLYLLLRVGRTQPEDIDRLAEVLRREPGPCPVYLTIKDGADKFCVLRLGRDFAINPNTFPQDDLEAILGPNSVRLM